VLSATSYHFWCVTAENVPAAVFPTNGNLLPSDHLEDVQPHSQCREHLQTTLFIEVDASGAIDFGKSRIRPKATGVESSGKKNTNMLWGGWWCQEGILN